MKSLMKTLLLTAALLVGLHCGATKALAIGEAGTFYLQPDFYVYGVAQDSVNSIISFGGSAGYFVTDGLSLGLEAMAYSFNQRSINRPALYNAARNDGYETNPWGFGFNALVRFYPIRTDKAALYLGSGLGGLFTGNPVPYWQNGSKGATSHLTLPVDLGLTFMLTDNVGVDLAARYQRIGFTNQGLDAIGGHVGLRITF